MLLLVLHRRIFQPLNVLTQVLDLRVENRRAELSIIFLLRSCLNTPLVLDHLHLLRVHLGLKPRSLTLVKLKLHCNIVVDFTWRSLDANVHRVRFLMNNL